MRFRKLILFGVLAGVVAFIWLDEPDRAVPSRPGLPEKPADVSLKLPDRQGLERPRGELFGAPPAAVKAASPAPVAATRVAPPLPYRFAGKVQRGGEEEILITKGDIVFAVRVGDMLDGQYRVEAIGPDRIELAYVPLGTPERILITSALENSGRAPAAPSDKAQLRWEGPEKVVAGAVFEVALRVSTKEALRAAPMQLRFEPGVLEPVQVRPGKFFGEGNFTYRVNPDGSIFVGATSPSAAPGADAELVVVTLRPLKRGATAELSMSALSLQGSAGRAIAHDQVGTFRTAIQ